jgi:hypothetical protein
LLYIYKVMTREKGMQALRKYLLGFLVLVVGGLAAGLSESFVWLALGGSASILLSWPLVKYLGLIALTGSASND